MARNFVGEQPGIVVDGEQIGAKWTTVESTGFDGNLTPDDNTVQKCLQKLDDLTVTAGGGPCNIDGGRADENYGSCLTFDGGGA
jgi:hypothetical protein